MSASRLAWPLAASLSLHLLAAGLLSLGPVHAPGRPPLASILTVRLADVRPMPSTPAPPPTPSLTEPPPPPPPAPSTGSGDVTQKARFLAPPELSALEAIPVTTTGSLSLRLRVTAGGLVENVTLLRADPIPTPMLDGVLAALRRARLEPARIGERAVASELDLVIRYEPGPQVAD